jgi:hypothetical protein
MEILTEGEDFLIQRYTSGNWPQIRGQRPFIVTGPNFRRWTVAHSLQRYGEHRFVPELVQILSHVDADQRDLARESVAELLLREGICEALWASNVRTALPENLRWQTSVDQLAAEIPDCAPVSSWAIELLSGMSEPSHYRSYLLESGIALEVLIPPAEEV